MRRTSRYKISSLTPSQSFFSRRHLDHALSLRPESPQVLALARFPHETARRVWHVKSQHVSPVTNSLQMQPKGLFFLTLNSYSERRGDARAAVSHTANGHAEQCALKELCEVQMVYSNSAFMAAL